jgi:uncharacterized protein YbjT (DUF2867 family)
MTTLISGATGKVAAATAERLLDGGHPVRLLVRDRAKAEERFQGRNAEIVVADFDDPEALDAAFESVDAAFIALGSSLQQVDLEIALIDAAVRADTRHVVKLSTLGAAHDSVASVPRWHAAIEQHFTTTSVPIKTILRPSTFSANLLAAAPSVAKTSEWYGLAGDGRVSLIDTRDVSDAAFATLTNEDVAGRTWTLTGPEALTFAEVAAKLTEVLGREIRYVAIAEEGQRARLGAAGLPEWFVDLAIGLDAAVASDAMSVVTTEVDELTGHPPLPVQDFLRAYAGAFG